MSIGLDEPLRCTLAVEKLGTNGQTLKRVLNKDVNLILGRDQFGEIVLKMENGQRIEKFNLKNIQVHKRFAKEGKATIVLPDLQQRLMFSNSPPDKLILFIKTMTTKLECLKMKGFVSERKKLLSNIPSAFEDISPLQLKELQTVHNARVSKIESELFTPKGKRKRCMDSNVDKENKVSKSKVPRRSLPVTNLSRTVLAPVQLSKEQTTVLNAVLQGQNIFFTGSAGTGKSFLLRRVIGALPPQHTYATASTGVAACHIGGTTLHAFAGIGSGKATLEQCVELASRPLVAQQWKKCKHLIVDEISMVDGDFFDKLESVARMMKKNESPFGGIQLILCGDFLQLPPVRKFKEKLKFAFQSSAWRSCIDKYFELTEVRRQSDQKFVDILQNIRLGRCSSTTLSVLQATASHNVEKDGVLATRLCTHKEDVDIINNVHLNKLPGPSQSFEATDSDNVSVKVIDNMCPVRRRLDLRVGTQVMLAKNLDVSKGLVNGARGIVTGFETDIKGYPRVKFVCGETVVMRPEKWVFKTAGNCFVTRKQLPLKLAWAISIHKSQGMTLDCVEISLERVFESGQAYVALSRAKSLEGLRVIDFCSTCVRAHPDVLKFYKNLESSKSIY